MGLSGVPGRDGVCDGADWVETEPRHLGGEQRKGKIVIYVCQMILMELHQDGARDDPLMQFNQRSV